MSRPEQSTDKARPYAKECPEHHEPMELWWIDPSYLLPDYPQTLIPAWSCDECGDFTLGHQLEAERMTFCFMKDQLTLNKPS